MMKKKIFFALSALMLLSGCQFKTTNKVATPAAPTTPNSTAQAPATSQTPAATSPQKQTTKKQPPSQLDSIESDSEDMISDITRKNWASAQSKVLDMKTKYNELKPILTADSVSTKTINGISSAITQLEAAVKAQKSYESRVQANHLSGYVPDVADYYATAVPTDIGRLDCLGREFLLNVEKADWSSVGRNFEKADGLWKGVKAKMSPSMQADIDSFQKNMDLLKSAISSKNATTTNKLTNSLLEGIDTLEKDFMSPK